MKHAEEIINPKEQTMNDSRSQQYNHIMQQAQRTGNQKLIEYLRHRTEATLPSIKELNAQFGCQLVN